MVSDPDQEIIESIRRGHLRGFGALVDRHKERAMTLALRIVGEREDAEEVVQDAFLRAFRNLEQFRGESRFSTWFYRILYNACMARVTRRPKRGEPVNYGDEAIEMIESDEPSVQHALENEEEQAVLQEEITRLPETFRTALTLFYVQELSYDDMASILQMPLGTVKTNLSRGRLLLRKRVLERLKEEVNAA
jgi:RNA polymerase sigma-70 factor (ECF subfamily)